MQLLGDISEVKTPDPFGKRVDVLSTGPIHNVIHHGCCTYGPVGHHALNCPLYGHTNDVIDLKSSTWRSDHPLYWKWYWQMHCCYWQNEISWCRFKEGAD